MNQLEKYRFRLREFDALLNYSELLIAKLASIKALNAGREDAGTIFLKQMTHALSLRRLTPLTGEGVEGELWDLPSSCAVGRCVIESFDALGYLCFAKIPIEERGFRRLVALFHDQERRHKMLELIGSKHLMAQKIEKRHNELRTEVFAHPLMTAEMKKKFIKGSPPQYILSQRERNEQVGLNHKQYMVSTMFLSQHVHTTAISIHQLGSFKAGGTDELAMMSAPIDHSLPYLAMGIRGVVGMFPEANLPPSPQVTAILRRWCMVAQEGLQIPG